MIVWSFEQLECTRNDLKILFLVSSKSCIPLYMLCSFFRPGKIYNDFSTSDLFLPFPCFLQAQLRMLWDSHTFGWPSFWRWQCAYCQWLPSVSCQWPSGHQKVIRYRKNNPAPISECPSQKSKKHFPKAAFLQNLSSWEIWYERVL